MFGLEIELKEALKRPDLLFVDVRSPGEYEEASIPGAVNVPLFDNRVHHQLGTIYYQVGEQEARRVALEMVAPALPELVEKIASLCGEKSPLLYCKRGGLRSLSLYQVMSLVGIEVYRLRNGFKAYRRHVTERLKHYRLKNNLVVLNGLTGVGKTLVLKELKNRGIAVLDLEDLARHRGSVFGSVGFTGRRSQKDFDSLLLQALDRYYDEPFLVVEGEGRRIGNIYLPSFLVKAMEEGTHLLLTASLDTRVKRILEEYLQLPLPGKVLPELKSSLLSLKRRLGEQKTNLLANMLDEGNYYEVVKTLCRDYYDHYYRDSRPECADFRATIDATRIDLAADEIISLY